MGIETSQQRGGVVPYGVEQLLDIVVGLDRGVQCLFAGVTRMPLTAVLP